jgi:hypothetical protein
MGEVRCLPGCVRAIYASLPTARIVSVEAVSARFKRGVHERVLCAEVPTKRDLANRRQDRKAAEDAAL